MSDTTYIRKLYVDNYYGKTIEEILNWYPKFFRKDKDSIFQYLLQNEAQEEIVSIICYQDYVTNNKNVEYDEFSEETIGFFDLMTAIEELTLRYMCLCYYAESWFGKTKRPNEIRDKHISFEMLNKFYKKFGNFHYITPSEYQHYLKRRKDNREKHLYYKQVYYAYSLYEKIGEDNTISEDDKYKEVLDKYDATFCYKFLHETLPSMRGTKILNKKYFYEEMFESIIVI